MLATVRLNDELSELLTSITERFHKKKSDVIREAIRFYATELEKNQKTRMQKAMQKTAKSDFKEYKILEDTLNDGL
jgi:predicted transcriptional regulator